MPFTDLFETHYYDYTNVDDFNPESDDEDVDVLLLTPVIDRSLEALRLIRDHLSPDVRNWEGTISSGLAFHFRHLDLHIEGGGYLCRLSPRFTVTSKYVERKPLHSLEMELQRIDREDDEAQRSARRPRDSFHFAALILRMVETASAHQALWEDAGFTVAAHQDSTDLDSVPNTAQYFLGFTPKQICDDILPQYRIVHVESIIRNNLARRFVQYQDILRSRLMQRPLSELAHSVPPEHRRSRGNVSNQKEDLVEYILRPKLTFHGTRADLVPSIVQYGFLKPGSVHPATGASLPVRCGSTYGRGIYSSPSPNFSLAYSGPQCEGTKPGGIPGLKLIVCATIMGRSVQMYRKDNWREQSKPYPNSDSHIANDGQEYIVFDNAQILPCYVVHLHWATEEEADEYVWSNLGGNSTQSRTKSFNKRPWLQSLKQERLAQARKFFAYGFGPVSGKNIVIEDIADIDDDEEDYGEYQVDRLDDVQKVDIWGANRLEGETEKDEYSSQRKAKYRWRGDANDVDE
ncbi:hypothetical protein K435DRAFT_781494 [Dendrothele bispora CBS 962.96]|uniref:PARP catalytic domain-containing protein n=1 Tax=Dendrothele bispora (strain CBS 962.96) TaxID=1314807 RepID=A0A4S8LKK9_DENBC|nr:hypothetical protein K435DRAFT_781494 [Dendrothele bispora CBS 962.96]